MSVHKTPELSEELFNRIKLVRRDIGNLLFHFTRGPTERFVEVESSAGYRIRMPASAGAVLRKILHEGRLKGTSEWTYGYNCVCFTEAPIQELNSIFSLVDIAASEKERPRYKPYGIAVTKKWLFQQGGRPVIYDHPEAFDLIPEQHRYRFVPYDPERHIDFTWEREWRVKADSLSIDPRKSLVVVPTSEEAFDLVYEFADVKADFDRDGPVGTYHEPRWLAVSLDLFGYSE